MLYSPLEQFEILIYYNISFLGLDLSLTNASFYLILIFTTIVVFFYFSFYYSYVISNSWQLVFELLYSFMLKLYLRTLPLYALKFFPLFFCIFLFILFSNLLGLMPFGFTVTSHVFFTAFIGFSVFVGLTIRAFATFNVHFIKLYIVEGVPTALLPLLFVIEILSYWIRPISLSVRLFANMFAGHTLLNILSNFGITFLNKQFLIAVFPLLFVLAICVLEFGIAFLQAYVFVNLLCMYLSDTLRMAH